MLPRLTPDETPACYDFTCVKVTPEAPIRGWINGPIIMAVVHWSKDEEASKPCRKVMSDGKITCRCIQARIPTRKQGYCPFLTQDGEKVVIIVSNGVARKLIPLGHAAPLILSRSKVPKSPLLFKEWPNYERSEQRTNNVRRAKPVDIEAWLFKLWGDEVLRRFHESVPPLTQTPLPPDPPPAKKALGAEKKNSDNPVSLKALLGQIGLPLDPK